MLFQDMAELTSFFLVVIEVVGQISCNNLLENIIISGFGI